MRHGTKSDYETLSLFVILGVLTLVLVLGLRLVLFAPTDPSIVLPEIKAEQSLLPGGR
ncbi:MAG: hypothetical protein ACK5P7_01805 [Bdellovibrio sp.]|jgi:hypothetical protein